MRDHLHTLFCAFRLVPGPSRAVPAPSRAVPGPSRAGAVPNRNSHFLPFIPALFRGIIVLSKEDGV